MSTDLPVTDVTVTKPRATVAPAGIVSLSQVSHQLRHNAADAPADLLDDLIGAGGCCRRTHRGPGCEAQNRRLDMKPDVWIINNMAIKLTMTEALRRRAKEVGTIRPLAREAGIDASALSRFVSGEQSLRLDMADRLAAVLGVEVTIKPARKGAAKKGR